MIGSVTIKGFKSVVDQTIGLGRVNVFIGANGAGKSVVLEAIGVLGAAARGRVDDSSLLQRGVRPGVPALYKNAFIHTRIPRLIRLGAESTDTPSAVVEIALDNPIRQSGRPWRLSHEHLALGDRDYVTRGPRGAILWGPHGLKKSFKPADATRSVLDVPNPYNEPSKPVQDLLSDLRGYAIFDPQTPVLRGVDRENGPLDPVGIHGAGLASALFELHSEPTGRANRLGPIDVDEILRLIDWASDFGVADPSPDIISPTLPASGKIVRFTDKFMRGGRDLLSGYDASEGSLYVLFALVLAVHPRAPRVFGVENFDHALHPRLARELIRLFALQIKRLGKQTLITTHNPLVLDGLDLSDDDIRLFTVSRNGSGNTEIKRLTYGDALRKALESGLTLSQMWLQGMLGGVPKLV